MKNGKDHSPVVALKGGKLQEKDEGARIEIEGEKIELGMFVLSGEDVNGKRVLLTWNCNIDEMVSLSKTLEVVVGKRIEQLLDIN